MKFLRIIAGALALNTAATKPLLHSENQGTEEIDKRHLPSNAASKHLRVEVEKREEQVLESPNTSVPGYASGEFTNGQPINNANGRGGPISGEIRSPTRWFRSANDTRRYESRSGRPKPKQSRPRVHRQWSRCEPQMEIL